MGKSGSDESENLFDMLIIAHMSLFFQTCIWTCLRCPMEIKILESRSKLHGFDQLVVYLSESFPYALTFIWNSKKIGTKQKWVTCGLKNGIVCCEEQFPNQLQTFYEGVAGYLYVASKENTVHPIDNQEAMYYSSEPVKATDQIYIPDVDRDLQGRVRIYLYGAGQ